MLRITGKKGKGCAGPGAMHPSLVFRFIRFWLPASPTDGLPLGDTSSQRGRATAVRGRAECRR
eukprot:12565032-Alexandrium_andersonii.AAC.1